MRFSVIGILLVSVLGACVGTPGNPRQPDGPDGPDDPRPPDPPDETDEVKPDLWVVSVKMGEASGPDSLGTSSMDLEITIRNAGVKKPGILVGVPAKAPFSILVCAGLSPPQIPRPGPKDPQYNSIGMPFFFNPKKTVEYFTVTKNLPPAAKVKLTTKVYFENSYSKMPMYLYVFVDAFGQVDEKKEGNNLFEEPFVTPFVPGVVDHLEFFPPQ